MTFREIYLMSCESARILYEELERSGEAVKNALIEMCDSNCASCPMRLVGYSGEHCDPDRMLEYVALDVEEGRLLKDWFFAKHKYSSYSALGTVIPSIRYVTNDVCGSYSRTMGGCTYCPLKNIMDGRCSVDSIHRYMLLEFFGERGEPI